jgi:hypothetical protein
MAFTEQLKLSIKKRSHFCCSLCHALGVEVHHIVPQSDNGLDTEDNAAPLCPSCHETYGANPVKRKFIKEARDFWYELCSERYSKDPDALTNISVRLEQTASKADIATVIEMINRLLTSKPVQQNLVSVELPQRYWVLVLAALEPQMKAVVQEIERLRTAGHTLDTVDTIPEELLTGIVGTILARGTIIDKLVERGAMVPEASRLGAQQFLKASDKVAEEYRRKKNRK